MTRTWIVLSLAGILPALGPGSTRPASAHATLCNLIVRTPQESEWFGFALAAQGSRLAVGAPGDPVAAGQGSGAAYVYRRNGSGWSQEARLRTDGGRESRFGAAVAFQRDRLVVGAPAANGERVPGAGAVFLFSRSSGSWEPESPARVTAPDGARGDRFGAAVALGITGEADTLVVGAPSDGDAGSLSGSVYVFRRAGDQWSPPQKLRAPDGQATDQFGTVVAIDGDRLVVGAPFADEVPRRRNSGAAYVFQWNGEHWTFREKLKPPGFEEDDVRFGSSVALAGSLLVVGAPGDDRGGMNRGVAYVFRAEGSGWSQPLPLTPVDSDWGAGDQTGSSIAIGGNTLLVGAPFHRNDGARAGAVFRFSGSGTTWTEISPPLTGRDASQNDRFGSSVAISDDEIIFGGPLDDVDGQTNAGSVAVCETGVPPSELTCTKKGPSAVLAGETVTYTIEVANGGTTAATGVMLTDSTPAGLTFVPAGGPCAPDSACALGSLAPNEKRQVEMTFRVPAGCAQQNPITTTTPVLSADGLPRIECRIQQARTTVLIPPPQLTCEKRGPDSARPGDVVTYEIEVSNSGCPARDVTLFDPAPEGLECVSGPCGEAPRNLGTIGPDQSVQVSFRMDPGCSEKPSTDNIAYLNGRDAAGNSLPEENCTKSITWIEEADLAVQWDAPSIVEGGGSFDVFAVVTNAPGPHAAKGVAVDLSIENVDAVESFPEICSPVDGQPGRLRCLLGDMACGGSRSLDFRVRAPSCEGAPPPLIKMMAKAESVTPDPRPGDNSASSTTTVACCEQLAISKTADVDTAMPGQTVFYTIVVDNPGGTDVTATVEDVFPAELSDIRWCRDEGFPCTPIPAGNLLDTVLLPAGGSATYRASGTVDVEFTGTLANTASVSAPECDAVSATDETEIGFTGVKAFCTGIEGMNVEGGMITYTFLLINGGPAAQADNPGDEFKDSLPAGLTLTGASADSGTTATAGNMATWNGSIPVGGMVTITVTATIDAGTEGMTICNQAMIAFDADGNGTNESVGLSDDPSQPGDADPCCFQVLSALPIPALSTAGLAALALLLAALAWRRLRARGT